MTGRLIVTQGYIYIYIYIYIYKGIIIQYIKYYYQKKSQILCFFITMEITTARYNVLIV